MSESAPAEWGLRNAKDTHATSNKFLGDAHGNAAGWASNDKEFAALVGVEGDAGVEHVGWDNRTDYQANALGLKKTGGFYALPADAHANAAHTGLDDGRLGQATGMTGRGQSDELHQQVMASTGIKLSDKSGRSELRSTPTQRKQVSPGVALYTTKMEDSGTDKVIGMRYEGENTSSDGIELTVSIEGSRNLSFVGDGSKMSRAADIAPGSGRVLIGEVQLNNPDDGYSLKVGVGLASKMVTVTRAAPKPKQQQMPKLTVTQVSGGSTRKQSVVTPEERAQRDKDVEYLFNKYEDSSEMGLPKGISSNGLTKFAQKSNLTDGKLTEKKCGLIFQATKLGKKQDLNKERYQEALRKMAMEKNITFGELVQQAMEAEAMAEPMAHANRGQDMVGRGGTHSNNVTVKGKKGTILDTADGMAVVQMEDNSIEMVPTEELQYVHPKTETLATGEYIETKSQRFSMGKPAAQPVTVTKTTQQTVEKSSTITGEWRSRVRLPVSGEVEYDYR
jgi:hypothetical protein